MKAAIRGTEIYFDIAGMQLAPVGKNFETRPTIFLLHGGPGGDHLRYKQTTSGLQDVAQLVFIDNRGCGLSKKSKRADYSLENNIEDIEALRKYLGLEKICLLGTSYGGVVAQGYAIRYPQNVAKLILVVTTPSFRFLDEARKILRKRGTPQQITLCEELWEGEFKDPKHVAQFFKIMEPLYSNLAAKLKNRKPRKSHTVWSADALNEGFKNTLRKFDFIPQLKKIKCPTLVLAAQDDWICPPSQSKIIAKHIPNAQLKIIKDSGHSVSIDQNEKYIKAIRQFLKRK